VKKHAEFEQEVSANLNGISSLETYGKKLIESNNFAASEISSRLALLATQWKRLQSQTAIKSLQLKQTNQFVDFSREIKDLRTLLQAKTVVASSTDIGNDAEENEGLQKTFDDFHLDVKAQEARVDSMNADANSLASQSHPQISEIDGMKDVWRYLLKPLSYFCRDAVIVIESHNMQ
jgi:hypothetical protein